MFVIFICKDCYITASGRGQLFCKYRRMRGAHTGESLIYMANIVNLLWISF